MDILKILLDEFKLKERHIQNVVELLDEGNTIPFIARYRKEQTGEMQDSVIRDLSIRLDYLRNLEIRKDEVIRLIDEQDKLTEELRKDIEKATTLQRVEDLYRPYRKKRRTRATVAKEKGLEGLATIILEQKIEEEEFEKEIISYINEEKDVNNREEALQGAMDIIAEIVSDDPSFRQKIRENIFKRGIIVSEGIDKEEKSVYEMYYDYKEPIESIANHRILAMNRGEKDKKLIISIYINEEDMNKIINEEMKYIQIIL